MWLTNLRAQARLVLVLTLFGKKKCGKRKTKQTRITFGSQVKIAINIENFSHYNCHNLPVVMIVS